MKWTKVYLCILCLLVLDGIFENVIFPLTVRLFEFSICQRYFRTLGDSPDVISESDCKIIDVQTRLAFIRGVYSLCRSGPAIVVGPFYGALADRSGRRFAYALCVAGLLLQTQTLYMVCTLNEVFAPESAWLTGLFILIGGGQFVIIGLNFTMVTDISESENRSQYLYLAQAVRYAANVIGPHVAALALEHSLWLSTLIASLCLAATYPVLMAVSETRPVRRATASVRLASTPASSHSATLSLLHNRGVVLCVATTFLLQFRYMIESILIVYVPIVFDWTISQVTRFLSIIPAVSLGLFTALPWIQAQIFKSLSQYRKTLLVLLMLIFSLIAGSAMIVLATRITTFVVAIFVLAIGNGARAPLLSVAASYVDQTSEIATLYTLLSVTDAFAHVVGDPGLEFIWQGALHVGRPWLGMPFMITTVLFVVAILLVCCLPFEQHDPLEQTDEPVDATRPLLEGTEPRPERSTSPDQS